MMTVVAAMAFVALWVGAGLAQQAPATAQPNGARAQLDRARSQLDQIEATLKRGDLSDNSLQQMRATVDPELQRLTALVAESAPRVETLKARLAQLGPRPDPQAPPESADVARDRAERTRALQEAEETLQLARALAIQADQTIVDITDRRRAQFTRQLFARSSSPIDPRLWWQVSQNAPRDAEALALTLSDWGGVIANAQGYTRWLLLAAGLLGAFFVLGPLTRVGERFMTRDGTAQPSGVGEKAFRAGAIAVLGSIRPIAAAYVVHWGLDSAGLLPPRVSPVVLMALAGLAIVAAMRAIAQGLLAPETPGWRLPNMKDENAVTLQSAFIRATAVSMIGKTIETINQAISAGLPLTILAKSLFAGLFVAALWPALSASQPGDPSEEACLGPYVPPPATIAGPFRLLLGAALIGILVAALTGYVAFATFLVDQVLWVSVVGAGLLLGLALVDAAIAKALSPTTRTSRLLGESFGLRRKAVEQFAAAAAGLFKLFLCLVALLLVIAPWGVRSDDILSSARSALLGFTIGGVTISFSAIAGACVVLIGGVLLTRGAQRWLDEKYLPLTDIDAGLRNSIRTAFGYAGFATAAALALSSLGLSLDRVAIIAGALSVGIGFGLQSIVNNFVSGLILLWERPIRVGDLIDVGGDQGVVRRINVRSTEIETGDRSTVIMPNSNLVSGVVKNRVHNDRSGRVLVAVSTPRAFDPVIVSRILTDAANGHEDVLKKPAPSVFFKKIGDAQLDFELVCFVADVDLIGRVTSDLHFIVFREIVAKQPALDPPRLKVEGLGGVEGALGGIAESIARAPSGGTPAPSAEVKP
ncbi:MAG: mechanosensitive ion channel family protein [Rhizobiales bacterium]|nr:mechanosensitive ion channel family protein [Hyphomicrobiales bacterium]